MCEHLYLYAAVMKALVTRVTQPSRPAFKQRYAQECASFANVHIQPSSMPGSCLGKETGAAEPSVDQPVAAPPTAAAVVTTAPEAKASTMANKKVFIIYYSAYGRS